jgi:hypothetical protein
VILNVVFCGLARVMGGMQLVAVGDVRMMRRCLMSAALMVFSRLLVML